MTDPQAGKQLSSSTIVPYPACELPETVRVSSSRWLDASSTKGDIWNSTHLKNRRVHDSAIYHAVVPGMLDMKVE